MVNIITNIQTNPLVAGECCDSNHHLFNTHSHHSRGNISSSIITKKILATGIGDHEKMYGHFHRLRIQIIPRRLTLYRENWRNKTSCYTHYHAGSTKETFKYWRYVPAIFGSSQCEFGIIINRRLRVSIVESLFTCDKLIWCRVKRNWAMVQYDM